ncbi:MAG TPA: fumarate reductase subunit FrdD [Pseudonocardia sp.]|uniref:fumarate reductase subunit FrdD n=1 Tax=Pseudonocardia sp. TaxID=60912 RepID=UPI002EDA8E05
MRKRAPEPYLWLLFSSGGLVAAFLVPILLLLFGLAVPLGLVTPDYEHLRAVVGNPLTRLVLFGVCVLCLFHWAHRFRYTVYDGLQVKSRLIIVICYGGAIIGTVLAGYVLFGF